MRPIPRPSYRLLCLIAIFPATIGLSRAEEKLSFNTHIQPLLSEYCYHCHGPDSGTRKPKDAPLRLDREELAFLAREHGKPSIIKGNPAESDVVKRMRSTKESEIMPPPESHKTMKAEEIAIIERWIKEGAEYEEHWSFIPPQKHPVPTLPESAPAEWKKTATDAFLFAAMDKQGLSPNAPEEKSRLLRRVTFDLTGLPPTPEETSAFLADTSPDAYEKVVSRLLASPRYGEHMARHWLDAARYADTHGIHIDNYRSIWPYRDWVIKAINDNMPFDQFTIEQIGGDMLPEATIQQNVATGFNRCLPTTGEGGAIPEEYLAIYAKDRVETTSGVWLGLTMGCAACHDHKFDPISMKDFYAFSAFFRNTPMSGLDGNKADHPPNLFIPNEADQQRLQTIPAEKKNLADTIAAREKSAESDFLAWVASSASLPAIPAADWALPEPEKQLAKGERRDGPFGGFARSLNGSKDSVVTESFELDTPDSFTLSVWLRPEGTPGGAIIAKMDPGQDFRGWDLWLEGGRIGMHLVNHWPDNSLKVVAKNALENNRWNHVLIRRDGSKPGIDGMSIRVNGMPEAFEAMNNSLTGTIKNNVPLRLGARHKSESRINGGSVAIHDLRINRQALPDDVADAIGIAPSIAALLALPVEKRTADKAKSAFGYYLAKNVPELAEPRSKLTALEAEEVAIRQRGQITLVMKENADSKPVARIFERGEYSKPGEEVAANVPADLPQLAADQPANRLGLARWLVDRSNPLTARVTVNRVWHQFFGTGIVETTEDFGIMGARPSHPELLDTLAVELMDSAWNMKELSRRIVLTAVYRQSARSTPEKLEKDPRNRLLARAPRVRLDAEPLRDLALFSSGIMVEKLGGPSVKPYQPEGVWEAVAMKESNTRFYKQEEGEALYRRSLYTFWKRTAPHPAMETLNAPSREVFCTRRERTNTPLQALVLMNDPQFVEACRALAARTLKETADTDSRLNTIANRLLARAPDDRERAVLKSSLDDFLTTFRAEPEEAKKLISIGATPPPADADPAELAAWTLVASQILNMDECVTR
ncbi:MAG: DUF1553 domain-containing protein [Verrucomicrobiales bacterium]